MWSWLLGNNKAVEKVADAVISTGDALFFTDEEKSIASQKILDWKIAYAKATQGQSISRRIIAVGVTFMWVLVGLIALTAKFFGMDAFAIYSMHFLKDIVMQPFSIIVGFYFLAHVVSNFGKK